METAGRLTATPLAVMLLGAFAFSQWAVFSSAAPPDGRPTAAVAGARPPASSLGFLLLVSGRAEPDGEAFGRRRTPGVLPLNHERHVD